MSASVLQLQAVGTPDLYLTDDPKINVFKFHYYRYVNFATESYKLNINTLPTFGLKSTCEIPKRGNLLSKLHLHLKLPILEITSGEYACWNDTLGYSIFSEPIELHIGGVIVDRLYPQCMNILDEFKNNNQGLNMMLLKSDSFVSNYTNASKQVDLVIPLDFWFTKQYNCALPLNFQQDIKIVFKLRNFSECVNYDLTPPNYTPIITSNVYAEYIYLDDIILDKFMKQDHKFLIQQMQYNGDTMINGGISDYICKLNFNNPCKEILFVGVETGNITSNNYFAYSKSPDNSPLFQEMSLLLDGKPRFDQLPEFFYRLVFPQNVHTFIPLKYIYSMSFSLRPEDTQPTGSINLDLFNDVSLALKLNVNSSSIQLFVFALTYNIVKIEKGMLSFEWMN